MRLIFGVATAGCTAIWWWNRTQARSNAGGTVMGLRQQAGVLAAIVNCINALLDALLLVRRISAGASDGMRIGQRSEEAGV